MWVKPACGYDSSQPPLKPCSTFSVPVVVTLTTSIRALSDRWYDRGLIRFGYLHHRGLDQLVQMLLSTSLVAAAASFAGSGETSHCCQIRGNLTEMTRQVAVVLYVVAMAAIIVGVDFMFFRSRFWERLIVNIGIVLVFAAFYFRFLRRP